jgi:hypothetical protein
MSDALALPTGAFAEASLFLGQSTETKPIADHSIRSFFYARLLAEHEGSVEDAECDETLLSAACVLHDLGLGGRAAGHARSRSRTPASPPNSSPSAASRKRTSIASGKPSPCTARSDLPIAAACSPTSLTRACSPTPAA